MPATNSVETRVSSRANKLIRVAFYCIVSLLFSSCLDGGLVGQSPPRQFVERVATRCDRHCRDSGFDDWDYGELDIGKGNDRGFSNGVSVGGNSSLGLRYDRRWHHHRKPCHHQWRDFLCGDRISRQHIRVCANDAQSHPSAGVTVSASVSTPALVQATSTYPGVNTGSLAFASDNTAGNTIVVAVQSVGVGGAMPTVTDSSNTYVLLASSQDPVAASEMYVYMATNIAAGPNTRSSDD